MNKNFNFQWSTLIRRGRRRRIHARDICKQQEEAIGKSSRIVWEQRTSNCHPGQYEYSANCFSTRAPVVSVPHRVLLRKDASPIGRQLLSVTTGTTTHQSPGHEGIQPSFHLFHSSTTVAHPGTSWNARVKEFLARTATSLVNDDDVDPTTTTAERHRVESLSSELPLSPSEVAETLQTLLDDLLEITAAAHARTVQKGGFPNNETETAAYDAQSSQAYDNNNQNHPYLHWINPLGSIDESSQQSNTSVPNILPEETIDVGLAFALMDHLVALEQADDSPLINHTLKWTAHASCLNPVLQLWKQGYSPSTHENSKVPQPPAVVALAPSQVLSKLDSYRQNSNLLIPDVQSYNIILDAVATHNPSNSAGRNNKTSRSATRKGVVVDMDFCQSLWEWMWKESHQDSLVRPDEITLRIMLKANVFTGHALAAQRCEALVDEWANYHKDHDGHHNHSNSKSQNQHDDDDPDQKTTIHDPRGTLLQSLIHVWALSNPQIAESYLNELARRYLAGQSHNPPDTISWNRVVSAYAIAHHQPARALQVLEDFWEFYRRAHGLDDDPESEPTTTTAGVDLESSAADSGSINTKSNSLKLSNAIAISSSKEESGTTEPLSSAMDSAIWKVHPPNIQTYNALLEGYARQNNAREANKILERVHNAASMSPNIATYTSAMKANERDLERVKDIVQRCLTAYNEQTNPREESKEADGAKHLTLDRPFFHAWLHACATAENVKEAKIVIKEMKSFNITPNATTYRLLIEVFLSSQDSQGAIEWLLAYAKLEGMSESAIVSCTTLLLDWYRFHDPSPNSSGDVDAMVLLQILCENGFITQEESLQQLLLNISPKQATAVLGFLRRKKDGTSLKMWAIAIRALAQETSHAPDVEDMFLQLQEEPSWAEKFDETNASRFNDDEEKLIAEMYSSIVIAWSKQGKLNRRVKRRIQHWKNELKKHREGALSLNLAAQVALVKMYSEAGDPQSSEQYVIDLYKDYEEGKVTSPPDTIMCNMVLNAWAKNSNGPRAAAFFEERIKEPDAVSYNTVINAFARQGNLETAEEWACRLIASFVEHPLESQRPHQATFTVLLAAWRRSKHPNAAERAEKILKQMHELYDSDILLSKPNLKSYQTVLDTWEKSSRMDAAQKAHELLLSSDYKTNKKLAKKVRNIKSRREKANRRLQEENKKSY